MQHDLPAGLGGGAPSTQWAVAAQGAERGDAGGADRPGVAGRAGDRLVVFVAAGLLVGGGVVIYAFGAVVADGDICGEEPFGDGWVAVVSPGGLGQFLVRDDPGVGFGDRVGPVAVAAGLG